MPFALLSPKDAREIQTFFIWIAAFVPEAASVIPIEIKTLLASDLSTFLIKGKYVFRNGPKSSIIDAIRKS